MSDLSLKSAKALFARSDVAAVVGAGKLDAIYEGKAASGAAFPYGIIMRYAPRAPQRSFGPTIQAEEELFVLKVVTDRSPVAGQSPQLFAEEMSNTWEQTVTGALTLTGGGTATWCERFTDMPPYEEPNGDGFIYHRGFILRVVSHPA